MNGRRSLFGAAAALVVAPGAAAVAQGMAAMTIPSSGGAATATPLPDAALIGWCAEFDALERRWQELCNFTPDAEWERFIDGDVHAHKKRLQAPLLDLICSTPAQTVAGAAAVASTILLWRAEGALPHTDHRHHPDDERLEAVLLAGLLTMRGAA